MNNSVGSAIEKIKLQEQDNEVKLKERREYEATVTSLHRVLRETILYIDNSVQDHTLMERKVDSLRSEVLLARTRRDALVEQVKACTKELRELRTKSEEGIMKVWELRSSLCATVQEVADDCDIRALLIKPIQHEITPPPPVKKTVTINNDQVSQSEAKLKAAIEKNKKAISERDRLMAEPEVGEEFVRIKNALQYSLEMINNLSK